MHEILPLLPKPSHFLGAEAGAVRKDPDKVRARMALAFPDLYNVGMSYLGQMLLYEAVNSRPGLWAERVYAPTPEAAAVLRERGCPLSTLESHTPLGRMDAVGFSLTHELCYTNVLYMLDLAGISLCSADRREDEPIVMAGGGCTFNAEPLAEYMDIMVLGDGEEILPELLERIAQARREGLPRRDLLLELSRIQGVYVPAFFEDQGPGLPLKPLVPGYERVDKRLVLDLDSVAYPTFSPQPYEAVHDRFTLEIARGCTRGCRFCQAGMIYRPVRERSVARLEELLEKGIRDSGQSDVSFLALSAGDFSALNRLFAATVDRCRQEQVAISLPSLRVGSVDPGIARSIAGIRRTGATLAPEAGSQRLRDVINKGGTEEELLEHVRTLFSLGWQSVKLYFMMGLPTETMEDLKAILDLCRKVEDAAGRTKRLQVTAAVSTFVPKPQTPFQWEGQLGLEETRERIDFLKNLFRPYRRLKLRWHIPEMSFLEGVFSRGDRRLAPLIREAYARGCLFASWNDKLELAPWLKAMETVGLDPAEFLRPRDPEAALPWDHLNCGVDKEFLLRERARALGEAPKVTSDCRFNACRQCGVCGPLTTGRDSSLASQGQEPGPRLNQADRDQQRTVPDAGMEREFAEAAMPKPSVSAEALAEKAARFRLWYSKTGRAAFLSQLELQSLLERSLRRGKLPMSFSQGFHPLPRLSFARALPVGVESLAEYAEIWLREHLSVGDVSAALAPQLPEGLRLQRVEELGPGKFPESSIELFRLVLRRPESGEDRRLLEESWSRFEESEQWEWTRETKKGQKTVNLRVMVRNIRIDETGVSFAMDWSSGYASPLAAVRQIMPQPDMSRWTLVKTEQRFPDGAV